jgi:hypothetical protein
MTENMVKDAERMANEINAKNGFAKARVWTVKKDDGTVKKLRIYLDRGYIDFRDNGDVYMCNVGRNYYTETIDVINSSSYKRVAV